MYNTVIFIHILMKHLLLQITYFHQEGIIKTPTSSIRSEQPKNHNNSVYIIFYIL
jgi:hypothetical protein